MIVDVLCLRTMVVVGEANELSPVLSRFTGVTIDGDERTVEDVVDVDESDPIIVVG